MRRAECIQDILNTLAKLTEELERAQSFAEKANIWHSIILLNKSLAHEARALCEELEKIA